MTLVKVCGLRSLADARAALDAGANLLGFIFWRPGKRYIAPLNAAQIVTTLREEGHAFEAVGVFVDPSLAEVEEATTVCPLDYVQLSGDEPAELVAAMPRPTIKAIHVRRGEETAAVGLVETNALGAQRYLLDTHADGLPGGTGVAFDWAALRLIGPRCLVAGGLRTENVASALLILSPLGVDVSSGVEFPGGGKDPSLIQAFVEAVRTYDYAQH
ncbi:MAG TPA: phosphoribosylanthranilate isomerase [Chloroflexota bacterium]|jgi:phosphoribosylanthranilate isomerase|nr:phosphoribosylanthranilate isomerase [Chloroflexota bacterium]